VPADGFEAADRIRRGVNPEAAATSRPGGCPQVHALADRPPAPRCHQHRRQTQSSASPDAAQDRVVSALPPIRLAVPTDARAIAVLSRDVIEHGLGWSYTPDRIRAALHNRSTNVAVIHARGCLLAAGVMDYGDTSGHLVLLGVQRSQRRHGLGRHLLAWLEEVAVVAGLRAIRVEVRADNPVAVAFYRSQGYDVRDRVSGYYRGMLDAVRMAKMLGVQPTPPSATPGRRSTPGPGSAFLGR